MESIIMIFGTMGFNLWFIWPFIFVFGFALGIDECIKKDKPFNFYMWAAAFALLMMLSAVLIVIV